jgi:hypothetical protein
MAITILEQATIIWNQSMMVLFSMPNDQLQSEEVCKYFHFWKQEELDLLRAYLKLKHNNTHTSQPTQTSEAT